MASTVNLIFIVLLAAASFAQSAPDKQSASAEKTPQLDHFNPKNADSSVDPCTDFYQYSCNTWIKNNPVPADEIFWGSFGKLQLWNTSFVHQTVLEVAAKPQAQRSPVEQKVGDYWTACTDEKQRNASSLDNLRPEIQKIDGMNDKAEIADIVADLHLTISGAWNAAEPETYAALFGFGSSPDFHNTAMVIGEFDQGGMGLPGRQFYLDNDAKSVDVRNKYTAYLAKLYQLAGEPQAQANADAAVVLQMETAMAKSAMDIVKRRDPHNLDNEMSLEEVKKLAPDFNWARYLELVNAPPSQKIIVTSPDFFRGMES